MNDALIWLRALHFTATISVAGALLFQALIGEPSLRAAPGNGHMPVIVRNRLAWIVWVSFAFILLTATGWLIVQAARMTDLSISSVFSDGAVPNVLANTDFGNVWLVRAVLAVLLAGALLFEARLQTDALVRGALSVGLAMSLVGTLAFAGHAAAGSEIEGTVQLIADILHLVAAAAWLGALLPLALLLSAACSKPDDAGILIACTATLRFSTLGIVSVGTLVASGIVNSWFLVGSVGGLVSTDYGRLLSLKVVLFFVMLSLAAFNRLRLTPRLVKERGAVRHSALRQLRNNSLTEAGLGLVILFLVGVLGTLPPALNE